MTSLVAVALFALLYFLALSIKRTKRRGRRIIEQVFLVDIIDGSRGINDLLGPDEDADEEPTEAKEDTYEAQSSAITEDPRHFQ